MILLSTLSTPSKNLQGLYFQFILLFQYFYVLTFFDNIPDSKVFVLLMKSMACFAFRNSFSDRYSIIKQYKKKFIPLWYCLIVIYLCSHTKNNLSFYMLSHSFIFLCSYTNKDFYFFYIFSNSRCFLYNYVSSKIYKLSEIPENQEL